VRIATAVLLLALCAPELFAGSGTSLIPIDVIVQDSSGNPITDLTPGDFDLAVDGRPVPATGLDPVPGDPLRSIAILIDDLGMGERAMQSTLAAIDVVGQSMRPGDAVAVVTTGDKSSPQPRLSMRKSAVALALNPNHRPGVLDAGFCKRPDPASSILKTLSVLRRSVDGLRDLPGRKSVVFVSEGFVPKTADVSAAWKELLLYANRSDVDISTLDPRGNVAPSLSQMDCPALRADELSASRRTLAELAAATSGRAIMDAGDLRESLSLLMRRGSGYYLIAANAAPDSTGYHAVSIHLKRPGAVALYHSSLFESRAGDASVRIGAAIASPFALPGIRASISSRFWDDTADGATIQSAVWIDARDLTLSPKGEGGSEATFELVADTLDESSRLVDHFSQRYNVDVPNPYRTTVLGDGLTQRLRLPVKTPGVYQVRIAVHDRPSDRIGSDSGFVVVPDLAGGKLALSGIVIGKSGDTGVAADASPRRFHPGQTITVTCQIVNASSAGVDVTTSLIHEGSVLATTQPALVDGAGQADLKRILRARQFQLGEDLEPGTYSLRIDAKDRNANSTASQAVEFEVN